MPWSAGFNELYLDKKHVFEGLLNCYPSIKTALQSHPDLFDDQNVLLFLYMLHANNLLPLDSYEFSTHVADILKTEKYFCELLVLMNRYEGSSSVIYQAIVSLSDLEQLNFKNFYGLANLALVNGKAAVFFSRVIGSLVFYNILKKENSHEVLPLIFEYLPEYRLIDSFFISIFGDNYHSQLQGFYWDEILRMAKMGGDCFVRLTCLFENLMRLNKGSEEIVEKYFSRLKTLKSELEIKEYLICEARELNKFNFIDDRLRSIFYDKSRNIYLLCSAGFNIDDLEEYFLRHDRKVIEDILSSVDDSNTNFMAELFKHEEMDVFPKCEFLNVKILALLGLIRDSLACMQTDVESILKTFALYINKAILQDDFVKSLEIFLAWIVEFEHLDIREDVRNNMSQNYEAVILVCETGIPVETFAKLVPFHQKIFEFMDEGTAIVLKAINKFCSDSVKCLMLMNGVEVMSEIAKVLEERGELEENSNSLRVMAARMLQRLDDGAALSAAFVRDFFSEQLEWLRSEPAILAYPSKVGLFLSDASNDAYDEDDEDDVAEEVGSNASFSSGA